MELHDWAKELGNEGTACEKCPLMIKGKECYASENVRRKIGCPIREEVGKAESKANNGVTIDECVIGKEYWLDDCMDESGVYVGNRKWIPTIRKYYALDNDGLIRLNGGLFYPKSNNAKSESENKIRISIPTDYTAKIENNTVIFEPKTAKFKKGDFVHFFGEYKYGGCAIISHIDNSLDTNNCYYFAMVNQSGKLFLSDSVSNVESWDEFRLATDPEKQILLDKLHEDGKDWDAEKCEIVDLVWRPEAGDTIWSINAKGLINEWTFSGRGSFVPDSMDFRTPELAEAALESLKQSKHY